MNGKNNHFISQLSGICVSYLALGLANEVDGRPLRLLEGDGRVGEAEADVGLDVLRLALAGPGQVRDLEVADNDLGERLVLELEHVGLPDGEGAVVELHEELLGHVVGVVRRLRHLLLAVEVDVQHHRADVVPLLVEAVRLDLELLVKGKINRIVLI